MFDSHRRRSTHCHGADVCSCQDEQGRRLRRRYNPGGNGKTYLTSPSQEHLLTHGKFISMATLGVVVAVGVNQGGRRSRFLTVEQNMTNRKLSFARQLLYLWAITILKISIALFLCRFSPHRYYRRFLKTCAVLLILTTVCATLAVLLQCQPVAFVWDKSLIGTCYDVGTLTAIWYTINGKWSSDFPSVFVD